MKFVMITVLAGVLLACSDLHKSEQIDSIASMQATMVDVEQQIDSIDMHQLESFHSRSKVLHDSIKQRITDTIDLETALLLDRFKQLRFALQPISNEKERMKKNVQLELEALKRLRSDIAAGNGKRQHYPDYIESEMKNTELIRKQVVDLRERVKKIEHDFPRLAEEIELKLGTFNSRMEQ